MSEEVSKNYAIILAYFRGDGGPGVIEHPFPLNQTEYDQLVMRMKDAKTSQEMILRATDAVHKIDEHRKETMHTVFNNASTRIAWISLSCLETSGKRLIITPQDDDFYTPKQHMPPGYKNWNDPENN